MSVELSNLGKRVASFNLLCDKESQRDRSENCQTVKHVGLNIKFNNKTSFLKLARAGFCFSEKSGIHCFKCSVVFNQWDIESPVGVHRILNPKCPFLKSDVKVNGSKLFINSSKLSSPIDSIPPNYHCGNDHQSLNGINARVGETPPSSGLGLANANGTNNQEVENIRRNLFPNEDQNVRSNPELEKPLKGIEDIKSHSVEFTGKIIHPHIDDKQLMCRESFRLLTFTDPSDIKSEEWAKNGFIFIGNNEVKCVYCEKCASYDENCVVDTHNRISPKGKYCCPIVSGIDVGDVSRELEVIVREKIRNSENVADDIENKRQYPVLHPSFAASESRLMSFKFWSKQYRQTKDVLSASGFFYTGVGTKVICFCCGLAITDWELTAEPWQQHALLSPSCHFIKVEKGDNFIQQMKNIKKQVDEDPRVTAPVCKIDGMIVPDPYSDTIDKTLLTSFTSCGYSTQQLYQYIVKIFNITCGRYPDMDMLKAAVLADGELKKKEDMLDLKDEVIEKSKKQLDQIEQVMTAKDQLTKSTVASINKKHCVVLNKLDQKDEQLQQKRQQLQRKDQRVHQLHRKLHRTKHHLRQHITENEQLSSENEQLSSEVEQLSSENEQLSSENEQLSSENEELSSENEEQASQIEILTQQTELYLTLSRQIEDEKLKIERELSHLATELSRIKSAGRVAVDGDNNRICLFCTTEDKIAMFKPCRHICCCMNCLPNFKGKPCPLCRTPIQGWQSVFLS